ncbi:hypothetical protein C8J56DRAFT_338555 [Mycena floridula]|nr:hypothetical protein C8J56DRAFT_338555 [Mycena floridula]
MQPLPWLSTVTNLRTLILRNLNEAPPEFWSPKYQVSVHPRLCCGYHRGNFNYTENLSCESLQTLCHLGAVTFCDDRNRALAASSPDSNEIKLAYRRCRSILCISFVRRSLFQLHRAISYQAESDMSLYSQRRGTRRDEFIKLFQSVPFLTRLTVTTFKNEPIIST